MNVNMTDAVGAYATARAQNGEIGAMFICCVVMLYIVYNRVQACSEGGSRIQLSVGSRAASVGIASDGRATLSARHLRSLKTPYFSVISV